MITTFFYPKNLNILPLFLTILIFICGCSAEEDPETKQSLTKPVLTSPADNATGVAIDATLKWTASQGESVSYNVYIKSKNSSLPTTFIKTDKSPTTETTYKFTLSKGHSYEWYIEALDGQNTSVKSEEFSFSAINTPPTPPLPKKPANNSEVDLGTTFSWSESNDSDNVVGLVNYIVYLDTENPPQKTLISKESKSSSTFVSFVELSSGTYYWQVVAYEDENSTSESEVWSFKVK